ncbi:uncharacterized protein [Amphiura filiformis]|uniref:uncharacterized protein n=1 Tax=Amphiura filiformis TaxID=82378 RepID=UPI003B218AB2
MNTLLLALVVLACGVATTQALDCYNCHHDLVLTDNTCLNSGWDTDANNYTQETCSSGQVCQKKYDKLAGSVTSMDRRCVDEASCDNTGCQGAFSIYACEFCCSDDDLCNAGSSVIVSILALISSVFMIVVVNRS